MVMNDTAFIKACYGRNDGSIPLWIMRQAGRYLPEYRAVRKDVTFNQLCQSPDIITEVVKQPIDRFGFDAAILFSDILTMLDPMGIPFEFDKGGPRTENPIETPDDVDRLCDIDVEEKLSFVFEAIKQIKKTLPDVPLIGFCGSPFTLSCYLIEGKGSKTFDKARKFIHRYPEATTRLFDLLSSVIARYLRAQVNAGADAIQLFESWGGVQSRNDFSLWSADQAQKIFSSLSDIDAPRIWFVNNIAPYLDIVNEVDCDVVGIDFRVDLVTAMKALPSKAIQGNLDPAILFGTTDEVTKATQSLLESVEETHRFIFNLGHGIQPTTPIESVTAVVETVHAFRTK